MAFFKKKNEPKLDDLVYENWKTNFGILGGKRFPLENENTYSTYYDKGEYFLELKRSNLFAWALNPYYRYSDFVLEGEIAFAENNPYSAMGFVFRYVNDENFYYFLISNKGYFRFDVVFNGNPMPGIPWTACPGIKPGESNSVMIIARGEYLSFYIDDEWAGEIIDDTLAAGNIAFAGQNYDQGETAFFKMSEFSIESRAVHVERNFLRWQSRIPVLPDSRITLSKSLFENGQLTPAAVQMKKALRNKKGSAGDHLYYAEVLNALGVYDLSEEEINKALELDDSLTEAVQEKAALLYQQNRFLDGRDYILSIQDRFPENPILYNLLGNCEYSLGNWTKAAEAYKKAFSFQEGIPLFLVNAARSLEMAGDKAAALGCYLKASRVLFRQENYGDLYNIFPRVQNLDPDNREVIAFQAKIFFHDNKIPEAKELIHELLEEEYSDSAIFYLAGVLRGDEGFREEAVDLLSRAAEMEPDYYLYWYKLAENLFFAGKEPEQALSRALELNREYPWSLNLFGLWEQERGEGARALEFFQKARDLAPGELDILLNLSESYSLQGMREEAFRVLEVEELEMEPRLLNHKGNLYARYREFGYAVRMYELALKEEPDNQDFLENLASACIEDDMILRAEEILNRLYEINPTPSVMNHYGTLALIKGEFTRAETAYSEALRLVPGDLVYMLNLASVALHKQNYEKAREHLEALEKTFPGREEVEQYRQRVRKQFEVKKTCGSCNREWWVPHTLPDQGALRLYGEPPADAPAGICPTCGTAYCVGCAGEHLKEDRFTCKTCGEFLKLSENWTKYLLKEIMEKVGR